MTARFSGTINEETAAHLRTLCERDGISATELLRRMVGFYTFVSDHERKGYQRLRW